MWDYNSTFGLVTKENGHSVPDEAIVRALNRTMPGAAH
jgi:hypothetical protein